MYKSLLIVTVLPLTANVLVTPGAASNTLVKNTLLTNTLTGADTVPNTVNVMVDPSVPYMNRCTSRSYTYTVPASALVSTVVYGALIST